jgi:uncharacterized protein (DUF169 family)
MSNPISLSDQLVNVLHPALPPIAIAFSDQVPPHVPAFDGTVAAGCSFWEKAAEKTFVTSAGDHALCSIGIYTHNLADAPDSQPQELQGSLEAMMGLDYVREDEIAALPVLKSQPKHAIYGPLDGFPMDPDLVLLFAHAQQGLIIAEAVARVDGGTPPAMGRPACAIVPQALNQQQAAMSLGCCGARTYLNSFSDDTALWALPAGKLAEYCEQITVLGRANQTLTAFHQRRKTDVAAGERPTVQESLQRIS